MQIPRIAQLVFLCVITVFLQVCLAGSLLAKPALRMALVIGNSDYQNVSKLNNPANDAKDIGAVLERLGFEVTSGIDLDYTRMRLAIRDFAEAASGAEVTLIYYAGHGIEVDNTNYLIPVNAELKRDRDVDFEAIRLDSIVDAISDSKGLKIVLVDACRNNPFLVEMERTSATRSIGRFGSDRPKRRDCWVFGARRDTCTGWHRAQQPLRTGPDAPYRRAGSGTWQAVPQGARHGLRNHQNRAGTLHIWLTAR
jgi:hypothetical protein